MMYRLRWLYGLMVGFGLGAIAWIIDVDSLYHQYKSIIATRDTSVPSMDVTSSLPILPAKETNLSKALLNEANFSLQVTETIREIATQHAVDIIQLNFLEDKVSQEVSKLHLKIRGPFNKVTGFIETMVQNALPIAITNFKYGRLVTGDYQMQMDLWAVKAQWCEKLNINLKEKTRSLFCSNPSQLQNFNAVYTTINYPFKQLQLVGLLQQGSQAVALIRLPTLQIIHVKVGALLGVEKNKVVAIDSHAVHLITQQSQQLVMHLKVN
ncbi:MAG: pilus assembly protein PilP [Gammaproteobacteria bacterium]|nr:pilus assembly protein PilP [Gammaproteobacteria bacterium]